MTHPLNIIYLHSPAPDDATVLPEMEYGLSDAFRSFCRKRKCVAKLTSRLSTMEKQT